MPTMTPLRNIAYPSTQPQYPQRTVQQTPTVYYQLSTANKSFRDMHYFLKSIGIKNNKYHLILYDKDLAGIDPHDPMLPTYMKQKVLRECLRNFWYFIREVVRIPSPGGTGGGVRYELHRGNLALNFCLMLNFNIFLELPRQHYKTISAICWFLWVYLFGTSNSEITFLHKKLEESSLNLQRLKDIRDLLPSYLQMSQPYSTNGKKVKPSNTILKIVHPLNNNKIRTAPSARNKVAAANLLRGRTIPVLWADEWGFIPYNDIIYLNTVPAFKTASLIAKQNGAPYGILLTTTPGFLTEDSGKVAYNMKEDSTEFNEAWYDLPYQQILEIIDANSKSNFVYIKFTYQQLGRSEAWFKDICKEMLFRWDDIRREVLLEWSLGTSNSPFSTEDLECIARLVREPIKIVYFLGKYIFNIYELIELRGGVPLYPPLVGVDVSGGYNRDASAICCVDSRTTRVFADLKCNYISTPELARVIYELVTKYFPNAVVNVERNGGFGASVLAKLINSPIKKNLYYEIKDKVIEEMNDGTRTIKRTQKTKVYGLDSTKAKRDLLIQILRERVDNHKDKFVSKRIYDELVGMEVKRNGKIEHSSNSHDDLTFAYLMALYIWYEGKDLKERFNITKTTIKTDETIDEVMYGLEEKYSDIITEIADASPMADDQEYKTQLKEFAKAQGKLYAQWVNEQLARDDAALNKLLRKKDGREAYAKEYNMNPNDIELESRAYGIPNEVFLNFNRDGSEIDYNNPHKNPNNKIPTMWDKL